VQTGKWELMGLYYVTATMSCRYAQEWKYETPNLVWYVSCTFVHFNSHTLRCIESQNYSLLHKMATKVVHYLVLSG